MSLLPSSPDVSPEGEPRVVGLDSEEADDLMAALSSETARCLLSELHEEPAPPSELADRVDTSLQNTQYHLEKLEDAGVIEVVGTAYSAKGREMRVYGPADSPLVIFAGEAERASGLRAALSRLFGGLLALAVGALAIQELFGESLLTGAGPDGGDAGAPAVGTPTGTPASGDGGATAFDADTPEPTPEPVPEATGTETGLETTTPAATGAPTEAAEASTPPPTGTPLPTEAAVPEGSSGLLDGVLATGLPPGLAFFLGGMTVLAVVVAVTYLRARP